MAKISSRHGLENARHSVKAYTRGHLPHLFAVLETDHPPADECVILVVDSDSEPSVKLEFRSLVVFEKLDAVLGIISPRSQTSLQRHSSVQVKRGRLGNKPAETLLILNRLPVGFLETPGPVLKGTLKAVERAIAEIRYSGRAHNLHWWLALEFAMKGWVRVSSLDNLTAELACSRPEFSDGILHENNLLIWREYLERTLQRLEEQLESPKNRNPFTDRLVASSISNLLGIRDPGVSAAIIRSFALKHSCEMLDDVQMLSCSLPSAYVPELSAEDGRVAAEITALFNGEDGVSRLALEQRYPSHLHVIANLFLSGRIVASPEGYIFTREQLLDYRDKLLAAGEDLSMPSVRVIKDSTGLGRRAAEALQSLCAELFRNGFLHSPRELLA